MPEITQRYRTPEYLVKVSWTKYTTERVDPVAVVGVVIRRRSAPDGRWWSYLYTRAYRRGATVRLSGGTVYWPLSEPETMGKYTQKVGEETARRYAIAVFRGETMLGECGCKGCSGVGYVVDERGRLGDPCPVCKGTGYANPDKRIVDSSVPAPTSSEAPGEPAKGKYWWLKVANDKRMAEARAKRRQR